MRRSENLDKLVAALVKFKAEVGPVPKSGYNTFHKSHYTTSDDLDTATKQQLIKNGLTVFHTTGYDDRQVYLTTTLYHTSGQFIEGDYPLVPMKNDPQAMGSCVTYARRYAKLAILDLAPDDDDANAASGKTVQQGESPAPLDTSMVKELDGDYILPIGRQKGKQLKQCTQDDLRGLIDWIKTLSDPAPKVSTLRFQLEGYLEKLKGKQATMARSVARVIADKDPGPGFDDPNLVGKPVDQSFAEERIPF
jgi:hypothetical protein